MANQPWMQQEEEAFLNNPAAVFNPGHYQALQTIRERVGLEYFGIDCGLDVSGNLVVFEVNASMLVHDRNEGIPLQDAGRSSDQAGIRGDAAKARGRFRLRPPRWVSVDPYFNSCTCSIAFRVPSLSSPLECCGLLSDPSMAGKFCGGGLLKAGVDRPAAVASLVSPASSISSDGGGAADVDAAFSVFDLLWFRLRNVDERRQNMMS